MFILSGHPHGLNLTCVAFAPRGRPLLVSGGEDGVRLWDLRSRAIVQALDTGGKGAASVAFSPDGDRVVAAVGERPSRIRTWEVPSGRLLQELRGGTVTLCAAFSPDGKDLAGCGYIYQTQGRTYHVRRWNVATGRERPPLLEHDGVVGGLVYSPNGRFLASASADRTAGLCNLRSRPRETVRLAHRGFVWGVAFSPDSQTLATAGGRMARLFDAASARQRGSLRGHTDFVYGLAFSPDGRTLGTVSGDGTARLWDPATRRQKAVFDWGVGRLHCIAFAPDGMTAAVGAALGDIVVWDLDEG